MGKTRRVAARANKRRQQRVEAEAAALADSQEARKVVETATAKPPAKKPRQTAVVAKPKKPRISKAKPKTTERTKGRFRKNKKE